MNSNKVNSDFEYRPVKISLDLSSMANKYLSEAAERSNRSKIQEAGLRLEDHLSRFDTIAILGKTSDREEEEKSS